MDHHVSYLEYGYPSIADIVKVDSSLVGVELPGATDIVVLVPVNAAVYAGPSHSRK